MKLLVLQHGPWEGPGKLLLEAAEKNRVDLEVARVWEKTVPGFSAYDGLLVLGGGANVDQEKRYPFLVDEKKYIRAAVAADKPYLGFCLGHQLLADALGARVGPNFCTSVGFVRGHLTHDGREHPAFEGLDKSMQLFEWHGQTVLEPVPKHLNVLMTSSECQVESLSVKGRPHLLGLQFDNHAAAVEDVAMWLQKDEKWLASIDDQNINPGRILADARLYEKEIAAWFGRLLANYFSLIR